MTSKRFAGFFLAAFTFAAFTATQSLAACVDCGTVIDLKSVTVKGESSGAGMVLGGVAGGVLGHQVGSGRGNTAATVVGAAGGAYVGNEIEKNKNTKTKYVVYVKMEDGSTRNWTYSNPTSYRVGDKVKVVDRKLVLR
ncbi:MAG TPA: glycine zipper 2TM domain-containing protein [Usitatibacter sp.]|nr:glycine zipper 2TM domain-containing protein [Usitatibacter sp.]